MALNIKEYSIENNISFEKALTLIARQMLMSMVSKSHFNEHLLLCEPESEYSKTLVYAYKADKKVTQEGMPGSALSDKLKGAILLSIIGVTKGEGIAIKGKQSADGSISVDMNIEKMRIPLKIELFQVPEAYARSVKKEILVIYLQEKITFLAYSDESEVAKNLYTIFKELDLINDMGIYFRTFNHIMKDHLEGKIVWSELRAFLSSPKVDVNSEILRRFIEYKEDSAMRKKWEKYIKRQEIESIEWKKIINAISVFINPIFETIIENRPFVGDWMPELGRFL